MEVWWGERSRTIRSAKEMGMNGQDLRTEVLMVSKRKKQYFSVKTPKSNVWSNTQEINENE